MALPIEPASEGQERFRQLVASRLLMSRATPPLSEADTRAKLIDPIFKDCLGWTESEIHREKPVKDGFADYTFGTDFLWFHVEAKREVPRFKFYAPSGRRELTLSGAHLLNNPDIADEIEQAAKYSVDLGTQFAVLTNGEQFIIFEASVRGRSWRTGKAIVFHDQQDVADHFAEFWALLGRPNVEMGSLSKAFSASRAVTRPSSTPLQYIHNPDAELIRNPFWSKISQAFAPLLIDQPENEALQDEVLRNCYVFSPLAGESRDDLAHLLQDMMPKFLVDAGVRNNPLNDRSPSSFRNKLVDDLKMAKPGTYVLTGGVGSGKTSFLRRFALVDQHEFIKNFCVWIHVDYLEFGNESGFELSRRLRDHTFLRILRTLRGRYSQFIPTDGEAMRAIFKDELDQLQLTVLHGVPEGDAKYVSVINSRVAELAQDIEIFVMAILRDIRRKGRCVVFVLDNTDQLGEIVQREVFLLSQQLSESFSTLSIVSLREEKFFAAYRNGVFDAYGTRKFHIGSPELIHVLRARLDYGLKRYQAASEAAGVDAAERVNVGKVIETLIDVSTRSNGNIIRFLTCVSAGDMRLALRMFHDFMSSGNTDVEKIQRIIAQHPERPYSMPFHEFAKAAILGSRRYFRGSVTRVLNLFTPSTAAGASYWTCSRILARLLAKASATSRHGEGFVDTPMLLREYRESFGSTDDFAMCVSRLLAAGLLESEPPRAADIYKTEALKITATGAYYWSFLVRSFAYLDLVLVDTPYFDDALSRDLGHSAEQTKEDMGLQPWIRMRIDRVQAFLRYLAQSEQEELKQAVREGGPYSESLCKPLSEQLAREIDEIRRRTGA